MTSFHISFRCTETKNISNFVTLFVPQTPKHNQSEVWHVCRRILFHCAAVFVLCTWMNNIEMNFLLETRIGHNFHILSSSLGELFYFRVLEINLEEKCLDLRKTLMLWWEMLLLNWDQQISLLTKHRRVWLVSLSTQMDEKLSTLLLIKFSHQLRYLFILNNLLILFDCLLDCYLSPSSLLCLQKLPEDATYRVEVEQWYKYISKVTHDKSDVSVQTLFSFFTIVNGTLKLHNYSSVTIYFYI